MRDCISIDTMHNTFQCALNNQKISDGANRDRKYQEMLVFRFFDWILDLITDGEHSIEKKKEIIDAKGLLVIDGYNMVSQLLNAQTDVHGNLVGECRFKVGHEFIITQEKGQLVLVDSKKPSRKKELTGITFNQLRLTVLLAYTRETGDPVSDFSLADSRIHTKDLALQLITAHAEPRVVFERYLITQRELGNDNIDISGFDLEVMDLAHISLVDVDLESGYFGQSINGAELDADTKNLISETEHQLSNIIDEDDLQYSELP